MNKYEALDAVHQAQGILESLSKLLKQASTVLELENLEQICDVAENENVVNILDYERIDEA
jgi:hypothetical protein